MNDNYIISIQAPPTFKRKKYSHFGKNPTVDTSFLPDRDREVIEGERGGERERERRKGGEENERRNENEYKVHLFYERLCRKKKSLRENA